MNITAETQAIRRHELRLWRAGNQRLSPPATGVAPTIEDMRKGRTLAEVWNIPRNLLPYAGK